MRRAARGAIRSRTSSGCSWDVYDFAGASPRCRRRRRNRRRPGMGRTCRRGWETCAWRAESRAADMRSCHHARVHDGNFAYRQLSIQLAKRTFPNLFDKCGPFQVDGDFGACAGIAEMLLQSHIRPTNNPNLYEIELLPALPDAWPNGSITGLCARGGFEVDMKWEDGKLTKAAVRSKLG